MIQLNNLCKQRKELIEVPNDELRSISGGGSLLGFTAPPSRPLPPPMTLPKQPNEYNTPFVVPSLPTPENPTFGVKGGDGRGNVFEVKQGSLSYENNGNGGAIQITPDGIGVAGKVSF